MTHSRFGRSAARRPPAALGSGRVVRMTPTRAGASGGPPVRCRARRVWRRPTAYGTTPSSWPATAPTATASLASRDGGRRFADQYVDGATCNAAQTGSTPNSHGSHQRTFIAVGVESAPGGSRSLGAAHGSLGDRLSCLAPRSGRPRLCTSVNLGLGNHLRTVTELVSHTLPEGTQLLTQREQSAPRAPSAPANTSAKSAHAAYLVS